jgi:hypothetical protein
MAFFVIRTIMRLFLLILFLFSPLFSEELSLRTQLQQAQERSWVVLEQNKNYVFFYIHKMDDQKIYIEEVTLPGSCLPYHAFSWKEWFEKGAPGHTLWTLSEINLHTGILEKMFSYNQRNWSQLGPCTSSFMTTLLNLPFRPVPYEERRRVGLPPPQRKADHRPFWQPRMVVDGQRLSHVRFAVWQTRWPNDGSELSRKRIEIYLPELDDAQRRYPTYFPYWLEVEGKLGSAKVRIVDSGMEAHSPTLQ